VTELSDLKKVSGCPAFFRKFLNHPQNGSNPHTKNHSKILKQNKLFTMKNATKRQQAHGFFYDALHITLVVFLASKKTSCAVWGVHHTILISLRIIFVPG
jgi:hypothetical protein